MKKIFVFLLLNFIAYQASAQFSVGIRTAYTKAWQDYGDVELPDNAEVHVNGIQVSALAYFKISKFLSIGLEPGYAERGAACIPGFTTFESDTRFFLDYVEVPVMVLGKLPVYKNKFEVIGKAGYGPSYIVRGIREDTDLWSLNPPVESDIPLDGFSQFNRWDHGFYGGLALGFNFGQSKIFIESNYYYGLKDFDNLNTSKNRSLNLGLGYTIKI